MPYSDWLAEVFWSKDGSNCGEISTGVPISRKCLLTTAHGVSDNENATIKVRFVDEFKRGIGWRNAKVIWYQYDDKIDAALLEFDEIKKLRPFKCSAIVPHSTVSWEGTGFPKAGKSFDGKRELIPLNGDYNPSAGRVKNELHLSTKIKPKKASDWQGISGAPVIWNGKFIGIIKSLPKEFDGSLLIATPMYRLLQIEDFKNRVDEELLKSCGKKLDEWGIKKNIVDKIISRLKKCNIDYLEFNPKSKIEIGDEAETQQLLFALHNNIEPFKIIQGIKFDLIPFISLKPNNTSIPYSYLSSSAISHHVLLNNSERKINGSKWPHNKLKAISLHEINQLTNYYSQKSDLILRVPEFAHLKHAIEMKLIKINMEYKEFVKSRNQNKVNYICRFFPSLSAKTIQLARTEITNPGRKIENINIRLELLC